MTKSHPLVVDSIHNLEDTPDVVVDEKPEHEALISMLREVSKVFGTRDIVEEYTACRCFPVREGWSITSRAAEDKWVGGIPMPNFATSFGIEKEGELLGVCLHFFNGLCLCRH